MLKKKIFVIFLSFILLMGMVVISHASTAGSITGQTVKLRETASTEGKLVVLLSVNNKVEVLGKEGDWYQITYEGKTGYVHKDYIKVDSEVENTNTTSQPEQKTEQEKQETTSPEQKTEEGIDSSSDQKVFKADTDLFLLPLIHSSKTGNEKTGAKATVLQEINGWSHITTDTMSGWVRADQLETAKTEQTKQEEPKQEETKTEEVKKEETNKKGYVNTDTLNVRKETNTTSEVVANLSKNAEVTILGEQDNWYKIKANGKEGYVYQKYISDKKAEVTNRSSTPREPIEQEENAQEESTGSNDNSTSGNAVVNYAKQFLGCTYRLGGKGPTVFDCSGFTSYVYRHFGISLSSNSAGQKNNGVGVAKANLQPGDIVCFTGHVGIYIGGNQFVHAANEQKGVTITSLSDSYYVKNYITARRVL